MTTLQPKIAQNFLIYETMRRTRIKQYFNWKTSDRKDTRQHWCSLWRVHHWCEVQFALLDLHHGLLAMSTLPGPWPFTLLVLLRLGALTDIVSRLPTIVAAMILRSIIVGWGCTRLVGLLLRLTVLEIPRRFVETGSSSSVQLKMTWEDPKYHSRQSRTFCLTHQ
jgi:hypothetical protein